MYPPADACKALYKLHPYLRLAWEGKPIPEDATGEDVLNCGSFAVVQLYHISDIGHLDDVQSFRELWDTTIGYTEWGQALREPIDRGPIFNKFGGTERDWDPLFRVPVFVCTLDEAYNFKREDVFSCAFLPRLQEWLRPFYDRFVETTKEKASRYQDKLDDMSEKATDYLWYLGNQTGAAYKQNDHNTPERTRRMKAREKGEFDMLSWLLPKQKPDFKRKL